MIVFNLKSGSNNFYSYEAIIRYLGKKDNVLGDWSFKTSEFTDCVEFEKELKKQIKLNKGVYEVVVNKLIWKSKKDHDIYNKIYNDPITGFLVFPTEENTPKANEVYTYSIANNKAKLI